MRTVKSRGGTKDTAVVNATSFHWEGLLVCVCILLTTGMQAWIFKNEQFLLKGDS